MGDYNNVKKASIFTLLTGVVSFLTALLLVCTGTLQEAMTPEKHLIGFLTDLTQMMKIVTLGVYFIPTIILFVLSIMHSVRIKNKKITAAYIILDVLIILINLGLLFFTLLYFEGNKI